MYLNFYNLTEKPFNLTPDPHFLYLGESHRKALTLMTYAVQERRGFMVVTGEVGTGKTTLIHALLRKLDTETQTVFIFNPILEVKDFFKFVCIDLGVKARDGTKGDCLLEIYQFLVKSYKKRRTVVMIIDEAHNLNPFLLEEIRLLSNFETAKDKLIQIILVGQPELTYTLNLAQFRPLKQRISLWFYINPLNRREADEYVTSRLYKAGMETSCFTEKAIDEIFRYSKGIPRLINVLCDHCLTVGYALDKNKIDEKIVKEAIADLETSESRSRGATEEPQPTDQASSRQEEKPKEPNLTEPKTTETRKEKKWASFSLILWACVLLLSGTLIVNFGLWSKGREAFKSSITTSIKKIIYLVDKTKSERVTQSPQR